MVVDYLIVGQGIAGALLGWMLHKAGKRIVIVDGFKGKAASMVAPGIINPVTGRRVVKSWLDDIVIPFAIATYQEIGQKLQVSIVRQTSILKILDSKEMAARYRERSWQEGYQSILQPATLPDSLIGILHPATGYYWIHGAAVIQVKQLLKALHLFFDQEKLFIPEQVKYNDICLNKESVKWKTIEARMAIFCEGYHVRNNPWFCNTPFVPAKGQILKIRIPGLKLNGIILHRNGFITETDHSHFLAGSTYEWNFQDDKPTVEGKREIAKKLERTLKVPFYIVDHYAGIRPAVKDRRPVIGIHPKFPQLAIFNGFGTKGVSLVPFFAERFARWLESGDALPAEADIHRFNQYF